MISPFHDVRFESDVSVSSDPRGESRPFLFIHLKSRDYSQSKGTDFLLWKFKQLGGFVTSGEHSKNEMYYFRVIRSLAEYFNFGTLFRRHDYQGEIVWPHPFKEVTEGFLQYEVEYGCS